MAVAVSSVPLPSDPEMQDGSMESTKRVKRQWGWNAYSYKFKTPFFKVKVKSPFMYGGGFHPYGGYGPYGYGYHHPLHMPYFYGAHGWI
uniref:Uncharacterized protein n=1 Tax=Elaeophora elaphi TaxID=1147741 RepID=A0A0R3S2B4_9BILA